MDKSTLEEIWRKNTDHFNAKSLTLPPYSSKGLFFTIEQESGKVEQVVEFDQLSVDNLLKVSSDLIKSPLSETRNLDTRKKEEGAGCIAQLFGYAGAYVVIKAVKDPFFDWFAIIIVAIISGILYTIGIAIWNIGRTSRKSKRDEEALDLVSRLEGNKNSVGDQSNGNIIYEFENDTEAEGYVAELGEMESEAEENNYNNFSSLGGPFSSLIELEDDKIKDQIGDVPYALYLRPFFSDSSYVVEVWDPSLTYSPEFPPELGKKQYLAFESFLEIGLYPFGNLIGLGIIEGNGFSGGEIYNSENDWEPRVELLAKHAGVIFVLPSERPGTTQEIEMLKRNKLFHKTIFVMPPAT